MTLHKVCCSIFASTVFVQLLVSCSSNVGPDTHRDDLIGTWKWVATKFGNRVIESPATKGFDKYLKLQIEGTMKTVTVSANGDTSVVEFDRWSIVSGAIVVGGNEFVLQIDTHFFVIPPGDTIYTLFNYTFNSHDSLNLEMPATDVNNSDYYRVPN